MHHQKPFDYKNHTKDDTLERLEQKRKVNQQYSFLLGNSLDRSKANIRTERVKVKNNPKLRSANGSAMSRNQTMKNPY